MTAIYGSRPETARNTMDRMTAIYGSRPETARNRMDTMIRMYGWTAQTEARESKGSPHLILAYPVHPVQYSVGSACIRAAACRS